MRRRLFAAIFRPMPGSDAIRPNRPCIWPHRSNVPMTMPPDCAGRSRNGSGRITRTATFSLSVAGLSPSPRGVWRGFGVMRSRSLDGSAGGAYMVLRPVRYIALALVTVLALRVFLPGSVITLGVLAILLLIAAYLAR